MTKRGIKSMPRLVKISCSLFLPSYSSGKFFCIMLFNVTLIKKKYKCYIMSSCKTELQHTFLDSPITTKRRASEKIFLVQ